ncbi:MAG: MRP family ATP-binding protein [Bacteroidetes bacterium QS_8_64_10]|jgi:ATP-binding protein involved in chromosome partitioning|nr:MAG: MRP family ATP-binding protein [Bacteroidetes bacterium QS_8_64_10]
MSVSREHVLQALKKVTHPEKEKNIVRLNMVKDLTTEDGAVSFTLIVERPDTAFAKQAQAACTQVLREEIDPDLEVDVELDNEMISLGDDVGVSGGSGDGGGGGGQQKQQRPQLAENMVAVASGKGGVGKSTVAANLAVGLAEQGYSVGLLDSDIYGPSIPTMFGVENKKPRVNQNKQIVPLEAHGVRLLSMGFLVDQEKAVIWRGPMVTNALRQFLNDAAWGELEYLILDLPPGTGDAQLTIVQTVPLTGAVIVSTPQDVALADARKGVKMFEKVDVPVLGMVENMSYFTPPDLPDRKYYLFGRGGAKRLAQEMDVSFLGEVPIEQRVRESSDDGTPIVLDAPESASAEALAQMAERTDEQVAIRNADQSATQKVEILYE